MASHAARRFESMDAQVDHGADRDLVRAVLAEEAAAIEALVVRLRCIPRILSVLNQRTGGTFQPDDMEDLTQDTLIAFWSRIPDYSGQAALETWAYGFCVNGFMSALRRRRNRGGADSIDEFAIAKVPPASSGSVEYEHVHRGLELLDEKETRVIRLKHFDDLTFEEIGARMRMSPNTAKTCYYRGMKRLEELLRRGREEVER